MKNVSICNDFCIMITISMANMLTFQVMLMNMGYRITGVMDGDQEGEQDGEGPVQCRPS